MKDLKYYVLGTKKSPLLKKYLEKFYQKLLLDLDALSKIGVLQTEIQALLTKPNRDFLLDADTSSLVHILYLEYVEKKSVFIGKRKLYKEKLKNEIRFFLAGRYEKLTMNKGEKILGTQVRLTLEDNNPYNHCEAHPEHHLTGGVLGWGEKKPQAWFEIYIKTFKLLQSLDEGLYDELNQIITKIIPLGTSQGVHNSASYKECIGHLYLGYTTNALKPEINNLEALIHESSHNKLNLLMQFDPLILNDQTPKYYSAIRPDARHMHGILLGIHAFVPTIYILTKAYMSGALGNDEFWLEKILLYHIKNKFMYKILNKYAHFTHLGKEVFEEIIYVMKLSDILITKLSPSNNTILRVGCIQRDHFQKVNELYPNLIY